MPPESLKYHAASPIKAIQNAILDNMYNYDPGDSSRMFICEHDLHDAWEDHNLNTIFPSTKFSPEERRKIRKEYLRVLSTLILIGWSSEDLVIKFRSQFLRAEGRKDNNLPLTKDEVAFLDHAAFVFWDYQFVFAPAIIIESDMSHIQKIGKETRLPFIRKAVQMGDGASGNVLQVEIAPRCLRNITENKENREPMVVACKSYTNERGSEKEFHKEVTNLDVLKEALRGSKRVMKHIAAIVHGNDFMILLPLAELYDLEIFLRCGDKPLADTRYHDNLYNFEEEFPSLKTDQKLHSALLREVFEVASALVWLHEEFYVYEYFGYYLAHMDLKPENILVTRDSKFPAGKWMLSDFGVSLFNKTTNEKSSQYHSIRDVGPRLTSRADRDQTIRGHGPYEPPEVQIRNVDGRKCDVWSFACILCDILAFAIGRSKGLLDFRSTRDVDGDDYFYRAKDSSEDRTKSISSSNTELKLEIKEWFQGLATRPNHSWIPHYIAVIEKALVPVPSERIDIRLVMHGLAELPQTELSELIRSINVPTPSLPLINAQIIPGTNQVNGHNATPGLHPRQPSSSRDNWKINTRNERLDVPPSTDRARTNHSPSDPFLTVLLREPTAELQQSQSQSQSSSSTESPRQLHRQTASNGIQASSNSSSDQSRSLSNPMSASNRMIPTANASAYGCLPKLTIPLSEEKPVSALTISQKGDQVAFLCGRRVRSFWIEDGVPSGTINELPLQAAWKKMCLAWPFLAVTGMAVRNKFIQIHDFDRKSYIKDIPVRWNNEQASNVLLSRHGILACIYRSHVGLFYLLDDDLQDLSVDSGLVINQACFIGDGSLLCLWASGPSADQAYFYDVNMRPVILHGKGIYEKASVSSKTFTMWPFESLPACVVHEDHGGTYIIQSFNQPQSELSVRRPLGIPSALVACVAQNDVLVCVQKGKLPGSKRQIHEYAMSEKPDGSRYLTQANSTLGSVDRSVVKTSEAVARFADGKLLLTLCTTNGEIFRYIRVC